MVLRKSNDDDFVPAPLSKAIPPYPTTPSDEHPPAFPVSPERAVDPPSTSRSPAFNIKTPEETRLPDDKHNSDSEFSEDEWNQSDDDFEDVNHNDVPAALKPATGKRPPVPSTTHASDGLPNALKPGPPAGIPIKRSQESISPMPTGASAASYNGSTVSERSNGSLPLQTNNPYLKMQTTGQSGWGDESSDAIWGDAPSHAHKYEAPVELPAFQTPSTPSHEMKNLGLDDHATPKESVRVVEPPVIAVNSPTPRSEHAEAAFDTNPWEPVSHDAKSETVPWTAPPPPAGFQDTSSQTAPTHVVTESAHPVQQAPPPTPIVPANTHIIDPTPPPPHYTPDETPPTLEEPPPALPPRRSHENMAPTMPPRPIETGGGSTIAPGPESPNTRMERQRKEHYQIKHIRWLDHNTEEMRVSPILTQNLNGPCPLLALVNALVLSTPARLDTALVETLRTRETISLGLLLDAVFDELMSGRRGDAAQALPDVSELYRFLLALHTGLNVNLMFVPDTNIPSNDHATLTNRAGAFENTQDMKLYRTFNIPLMHGWLPEVGTDAYAAFNRVAPSYETSQFVQFQEEELDAKLGAGESLDEDEQQMFTDIHAIKEFLMRWPTQLTDHGLKVIRDSLKPGQVAILFRNDHFSTLCKNPRNGELVTLVTDQGYSTHEEIVWESLTDVNGQGSLLFSGDFRSVDNSNASMVPQGQQQQDYDNGQGWTTVQGRRGNNQESSSLRGGGEGDATSPEALSRAEQEDHDLALALQLQEEEEDRQRRETEQRNARQNDTAPPPQPPRNQRNPVIPPRRNNIAGHRPAGEPAPPPLYEEAVHQPQYNPPAGHPASANAPVPGSGNGQGSAYQSSSGTAAAGRQSNHLPGRMGGRGGRRQSQGNGQGGVDGNGNERDKCVVM
ncbi:ubiquitin carboxyl-terminal hydrolase MINDY-1/2 [Alternaria panax]|uniref:Ubiquitin carboxyl-terminal hydrolase MINDY-1/2 n=1 Tax=Alternaria panax TaxID=48097 RepID=A0AAD4IK43_9PLEO|nr:ubiquitin carboxyl-terminal hydrolase MINDY-1/2 [Alternaria panax]